MRSDRNGKNVEGRGRVAKGKTFAKEAANGKGETWRAFSVRRLIPPRLDAYLLGERFSEKSRGTKEASAGSTKD